MRRYVTLFATALTLSLAGNAAASEMAPGGPLTETRASGPRNTITTNPLGMLLGAFEIEYERAVSPRVSWFIGPQYMFASDSTDGVETTVYAFGVGGGLRLFLTGAAPAGFFLSPLAAVVYASGENDRGAKASALGYSLGGMGGYTWIFGGVFDLSVGLGAQYTSADAKGDDGAKVGVSAVLPVLRASIGYAF